MIRVAMSVVALCLVIIGVFTISASGSPPAPRHDRVPPAATAAPHPPRLPWSKQEIRYIFKQAVRVHRQALRRARKRATVSRTEHRRALSSTTWAHSPAAIRVANCESGGGDSWTSYRGNPHVVASSGHYGKWQFAWSTWASVGGHGSPTTASETEQDYRAWLLWRRDGWSPWQCAGLVGVSS